MRVILIFITGLLLISQTHAVDRGNFKTCDQSGFCKRFKEKSNNNVASTFEGIFSSLKINETAAELTVKNTQTDVFYILEIIAYDSGVIRMRMREKSPERSRWEPMQGDVLTLTAPEVKFDIAEQSENNISLKWLKNHINIQAKPFRLDIAADGKLIAVINSLGLLSYETGTLPKPHDASSDDLGEETTPPHEQGETFKGHTDRQKYGFNSVGVDISLPNFERVFGIPEHADTFLLKSTKDTDPYRLYNLDVFEYELYNPMALYGSVPVMLAHNDKGTIGVFWNNPTETWIDVSYNQADQGIFKKFVGMLGNEDVKFQTDTRWVSESGVFDLFVMPGPTAADVMHQYATLTDTTRLPPLFSIAHHQCRWNYNDQEDVRSVSDNFDKYLIPMDVIWLDIEHTDGKRYFTWDKARFPEPVQMLDYLGTKHRRLVTIVDPHIKRVSDYSVYEDMKAKGYQVKTSDGGEYEGWCWPGSSAYPDYVRPEVRDWWSSHFTLPGDGEPNYPGSTKRLYTWNDMNEPSVFSGPEVTMPKDATHVNGIEHREVHNAYGHYVVMATFEGLLQKRYANVPAKDVRRPFVLTRAFFAGSQRYGAVWTGDNAAEWSHLKISTAMLLSLSVTGISFCGSDVGGFFGNPDVELLMRWYQAAAFHPFYRAHAHIDTRRREPYLYDKAQRDNMRQSLRMRYTYLPYWYTLFFENELFGMPPMRPLWFHFGSDPKTFAADDVIEQQFMVGDALLVRPIAEPGVTTTTVYLPAGAWYDTRYFTIATDPREHTGGNYKTLHADIDQGIPVLQRGGTIIPRWMRPRRASDAQHHDPMTLFVAVDDKHAATGSLYVDDFDGYGYLEGDFAYRLITFSNGTILTNMKHPKTPAMGHSKTKFKAKNEIERVLVLGMKRQAKGARVTLADGTDITPKAPVAGYNAELDMIVIRKPGVMVDDDFTITIEY